MKILEQRALRGPNRYSRYPTIFMLLDIGEFEERPSDTLPGFPERLVELLPTLDGHHCSVGQPGGFVQRLHRGTWAGHIVEHVALELQCLAGMEVGFGKTYDTAAAGVYRVVYRYRVESVGLRVGREAVALVEDVAQSRGVRRRPAGGRAQGASRGGHARALHPEHRGRGEAPRNPVQRLNDASLVQLGHGARQRRIQATMTDRTGALAVEIADEKFRTKTLLENAGIPTPEGSIVGTLGEAARVAEAIGYPVAVKPEVGNHGRGITARVSEAGALETAFVAARRRCTSVIVEKSLVGLDYRVLVIDGKLAAAALREPAHVVGDGRSSIGRLIELANADPRRGVGHERVLTIITVDDMTERLLALRGSSVDHVLRSGERVYLKSTANLSTGGTARDVTDEVHPDVRAMCERVARLVDMDCIGIDVVAPSLERPLDLIARESSRSTQPPDSGCTWIRARGKPATWPYRSSRCCFRRKTTSTFRSLPSRARMGRRRRQSSSPTP